MYNSIVDNKNSTKLVFLSCGDVLYENGYKTRVFGEIHLAGQFKEFDKYFITFEKPESYKKNNAQINKITQQLKNIGFQSYFYPRQNRWKIDSLLDAWKFAKLLKKINFSQGIIHAQSIYAGYMAILARGNNHKIKIIFDAHGLVGPELKAQKISWPMRLITKWVEKKCVLDSDHIVTASSSLAKLLSKRFRQNNITILPCLADKKYFNKVNFDNLIELKKKTGLPTDKKIAVYLGGMQQWQNFDEIKRFTRKNKMFLLLITNDVRQAQAIFADYKDKLIVSLPHSDVGEYLQLGDVGLLFRENNELNRIAYPTKVAEYLLSGLPVIHNGTVDDIETIIDSHNLGFNIQEQGILISDFKTNIEVKKRCREYALKNLVWETKKQELKNLYLSLTKKKICYLITGGFYGGAQKYNSDLAEYFNRSGFNFNSEVMFGNGGDTTLWEKILHDKNINYYKLKYLQRTINPFKEIMAFFELYNYLKKKKPDILHISSSKAGVLGRLAGWAARVEKIFYTAHGWVFNEDIWWGKRYFYLSLEKIMAYFCNRIFCVSKYDLKMAVKYGFDKNKLKLIYNGIQETSMKDNDDPCPNLSKHIQTLQTWKNENQIIIGTVANFFPPKNLGLFVEVAERLLVKNHNFRFVMIGDGPERKNVENMIRQNKLTEYFCLPGQVADFQKFAKYFDCFVLTSSKEGFPYILLEIGLLKVPIVAAKVGGVSELIIDRQTGYLVKNYMPENFAGKILEALKNDNLKITNNLSQKIVEDFSLDKMMDSYKREYQKRGPEDVLINLS